MSSLFLSPYTPFLIAAAHANPGGQRFCERRVVYYGACAHSDRQQRCNHPPNRARFREFVNDAIAARRSLPRFIRIQCTELCILTPEYVACYPNSLCPECEPLGFPDPPIDDETEYRAISERFMLRDGFSRERYFQLIREAGEGRNVVLMSNGPEELLRHPEWLGREILEELSAAADLLSGSEIDIGSGQSSDSDQSIIVPPALPDSANDPPRDWVVLAARNLSELTRAQWLERFRAIRVMQDDIGVPIGNRMYYIPNVPEDETDLLRRPDPEPRSDDMCIICQVNYGDDVNGDWRVLPCMHLFHYDEIRRWLENKRCPICRQTFQLTRVPLFADDPVLLLEQGLSRTLF